MLPLRVSRSLPFCQLPPLFLGTLSGGLSLWFTFCFCRNLWPTKAPLAVAVLGLLWECSKLYFGPRALRGLCARGWLTRAAHLPLLALTLVMMAGSVAASLGFTLQAESATRQVEIQKQAQALLLSGVLGSAQTDLAMRDREISTLVEVQAQQMAIHHLKAALQTAEALRQRYEMRDAAATRLAHLQAGGTSNGEPKGGSPDDALFIALGQSLGMEADAVRKGAHLTVAIMLELIGIASFVLLHQGEVSQTPRRRLPVSESAFVPPPPSRRAFVALKGGKVGNLKAAIRSGRCHGKKPRLTACSDSLGIGDAFFGRYQQARVLLAEERIVPTYRSLQRALHISQAPARRFLLAMHEEGLLDRVGSRYRKAAAA